MENEEWKVRVEWRLAMNNEVGHMEDGVRSENCGKIRRMEDENENGVWRVEIREESMEFSKWSPRLGNGSRVWTRVLMMVSEEQKVEDRIGRQYGQGQKEENGAQSLEIKMETGVWNTVWRKNEKEVINIGARQAQLL
jgi:hypothetical protein